jgi:hypothetical protein
MKRLLPTGLGLLLMVSSLGHVFAAAFCPRGLGHECCVAETQNHTRHSFSPHEDMSMHGMSMDGMPMDKSAMNCSSMDPAATNEGMTKDMTSADMSTPFLQPVVDEEAVAKAFEQSVELCAHCLIYSDPLNAPVPFVSIPDQSGKAVWSILLPVSRCLIRPAIALAQIGLARGNTPLGTRASRHILISVFLI